MNADLPTDIRAAKEAGFDFVEIWAAKLRRYLSTDTTADLGRLFQQSQIKPLSINSIEHITFRNAADYEKIKSECEQLSKIASELSCPYVVVVPGKLPSPEPSRESIVAESVRVLNELSDIAERYNVALAFEFLGQTDCSVQTLDLADEIVTQVDRKSVGLVIDSFHFYAGGSTMEMIEALEPNRLFIFHINDAEDLPREVLQDSHRLLPGLGILPLKNLLHSFRKINYDRVASVEIFRPEYWDWDPFVLAKQAKAAVSEVLNEPR